MAEGPSPNVTGNKAEELEKEVTCPVCQDHFTDPKILPCHHFYCKQCISDLAAVAARHRPNEPSFPCPECRADTVLPENSVDRLPTAFFMNRMVAVVERMEKVEEKNDFKCEMCLANKVEAFCRQCTEFICSECSKQHQRMKAKYPNHKISSLEDLRKSGVKNIPTTVSQRICELHNGPKNVYCYDCKVLICRDCTLVDHAGHKYDFNVKNVPQVKESNRDNLVPLGKPQVLFNKKKAKAEPLVAVHYCSSSASRSPLASPAAADRTPPPLPLKAAGYMEEMVYELLKKRPNGVLANRLLKEIKNMFKIDAPKDLKEKAKQFSFVECEVLTEECSVLHLKKPISRQSFPSKPLPPPPLPSTAVFESSQDIFDVLVSFISSPTSFCVRLLGPQHSEEFVKLETAMTSSLSQRATPPVGPVVPDRLYAYHWRWQGDSVWCRALATFLSADQVEVVFPDYGNTASVAVEELKQLPSEFHQLPFQAIHCCLHGLTETSSQAFDKLCELALDKTCIAQVMDRSGTRVSVELMDSEKEGLIINNLLLMELYPIASMSPSLPRPGEAMVPAVLCDMDEFGIATLQLPGPGRTMLQQLMNHINDVYSKKMTASSMVTKPVQGLVCCAKYSHDGQWYRVQVQAVQDKKVVVEYVDYGNEEVLEVARLRKAPDSDLMALPHQAVKCLLQDLPPPGGEWTEDAIAECCELIGCEDVYVEVVREREVPVVRLFMEQEGGEMVDLNQRLLQQLHLFLRPVEGAGPASQGPAGKGTPPLHPGSTDKVDALALNVHEKCALHGSHKATSILSTPSYCSPSSWEEPQTPPMFLPSSSQSAQSSLNFEQLPHQTAVPVFISSIESPSCFTVQLDSKLDALDDMMSRLAEVASALPRLPVLAVGLVCAACAEDQCWYRVFITAHSMRTATAEFLDYGGKEEFPIPQLRVLPEELLSLPFQGITAALHGVSPMDDRGWSEESKEMFEASAFVERLFAVGQCVEGGVSQVALLDPNKQETVVLNQQLLDKGLAK